MSLKTFLAREPRGELADHARIILDKLRATTVTASQVTLPALVQPSPNCLRR